MKALGLEHRTCIYQTNMSLGRVVVTFHDAEGAVVLLRNVVVSVIDGALHCSKFVPLFRG